MWTQPFVPGLTCINGLNSSQLMQTLAPCHNVMKLLKHQGTNVTLAFCTTAVVHPWLNQLSNDANLSFWSRCDEDCRAFGLSNIAGLELACLPQTARYLLSVRDCCQLH